jgi:hypothetical protein
MPALILAFSFGVAAAADRMVIAEYITNTS